MLLGHLYIRVTGATLSCDSLYTALSTQSYPGDERRDLLVQRGPAGFMLTINIDSLVVISWNTLLRRTLSFLSRLRRREYLHGLAMSPMSEKGQGCASYVFA